MKKKFIENVWCNVQNIPIHDIKMSFNHWFFPRHLFKTFFFNNKDKQINIGKIHYNNEHFGCIPYTTWWNSTRTYWNFILFWIFSFYKLIFEFWSFQHVMNIINERIDTHVQVVGLFIMWQSWGHNLTNLSLKLVIGNA